MPEFIFPLAFGGIELSVGGRKPVICEQCKSFLYDDSRMAVDSRWVLCPFCGHHFQAIPDSDAKERAHA